MNVKKNEENYIFAKKIALYLDQKNPNSILKFAHNSNLIFHIAWVNENMMDGAQKLIFDSQVI